MKHLSQETIFSVKMYYEQDKPKNPNSTSQFILLVP